MKANDFKIAAIHHGIRTADYDVEFDEYRRDRPDGEYDQMILIHVVVRRWTPRVLREALSKWKLFRSIVTCDLYATADFETPKWHKFVRRFGFTPLLDVLTISGEPRKMYIHRGGPSGPDRINDGRRLNSDD